MNLALLLALVYGFMSLLTYVVYALDKSAARGRKRRVPERTLHLLALLGGWPGALLAQQRLRHKTHKTAFRTVYWLTVLVNVSGGATLAVLQLRG